MTKLIVTAATLFLMSGAAIAADSPCKGLDESSCGALAGCAWQAARVAGEPSPSTGKPYKTSMKAHCRKPLQSKAAPKSKASTAL